MNRLIAEKLTRARMQKMRESREDRTSIRKATYASDTTRVLKKIGKEIDAKVNTFNRPQIDSSYLIIAAPDDWCYFTITGKEGDMYDIYVIDSEGYNFPEAGETDAVTLDQLDYTPTYLLKESDTTIVEEDLTLDDAPEETTQKYSSAATSINSKKLPALFNMVKFEKGSINLDYGGGKFDNVAEFLKDKYDATNLVYDKYNRSTEHNRKVLDTIRQNKGADTVTCSNVLNVIAEEDERLAVLRNCKRYLKSGGTCYITVYEGNGSGEGAPSKAGYQLNRKTKDYSEEINKVFSSVSLKGKLFICK